MQVLQHRNCTVGHKESGWKLIWRNGTCTTIPIILAYSCTKMDKSAEQQTPGTFYNFSIEAGKIPFTVFSLLTMYNEVPFLFFIWGKKQKMAVFQYFRILFEILKSPSFFSIVGPENHVSFPVWINYPTQWNQLLYVQYVHEGALCVLKTNELFLGSNRNKLKLNRLRLWFAILNKFGLIRCFKPVLKPTKTNPDNLKNLIYLFSSNGMWINKFYLRLKRKVKF